MPLRARDLVNNLGLIVYDASSSSGRHCCFPYYGFQERALDAITKKTSPLEHGPASATIKSNPNQREREL